MKYLHVLLVLCLTVCLAAAERSGKTEKPRKTEKNAAAATAAETPAPPPPPSPEAREIDRLRSAPKRDDVLRVLEELIKRLEADKDIPALDYGFYINRMKSFPNDKYLEANTGLDRAWFAETGKTLQGLQDNKLWRNTHASSGRNVHKQYPEAVRLFKGGVHKLEALHKKPKDASPALVKKQRAELDDLIKDLEKKALKREKEEARKARAERAKAKNAGGRQQLR